MLRGPEPHDTDRKRDREASIMFRKVVAYAVHNERLEQEKRDRYWGHQRRLDRLSESISAIGQVFGIILKGWMKLTEISK